MLLKQGLNYLYIIKYFLFAIKISTDSPCNQPIFALADSLAIVFCMKFAQLLQYARVNKRRNKSKQNKTEQNHRKRERRELFIKDHNWIEISSETDRL